MIKKKFIQCALMTILFIVLITNTVVAQSPGAFFTEHQNLSQHQNNISNVVNKPKAEKNRSVDYWTVDRSADEDDGECAADCTLREAIGLAGSGDIIHFDNSLVGATINLTDNITIDKDLTIDNSIHNARITISGNDLTGIFVIDYYDQLTLKNLTIANSFSSFGAIDNDMGSLIIEDCWFENNGTTNASGGALRNDQGDIIIRRSKFADNIGNNGGAIWNYGNLEIYDTTFENNLGRSRGGAIYNNINAGTLIVERSTFTGNQTTDYDGGAIYSEEHLDVSVTNSTFHNNSATNGGAVYTENFSSLFIMNSTFSENNATSGASGIHTFGHLQLYHSIVANSTSGADCYVNYLVSPISVNNLIENNSTGGYACGVPILTSDPNLGSLQDNGGYTQTMAITATSPAYEAGNTDPDECAATDQRGVSRPQETVCDLGAYELASAPIVLSSLRVDANPTTADTVNFTVSFSNSVTGVDTSDFALTTSGVSGASVSGVTGSGQTYNVSVDTGRGIGTIRLDVVDNDSIIANSVPLGGIGSGNGDYSGGEIYKIDSYPFFSSSPVLAVNVTDKYKYDIEVSDPDIRDGDSVEISAKSLPSWLALIDNGDGTGILSGSPDENEFGNYTISLSVKDSLNLSATQRFNIFVNRPPIFTSVPITTASVGKVYQYNISTSDPDRHAVDIVAITKPIWLSFVDLGNGSAELTGTPLEEQVGDHSIVLQVTDSLASSNQSFTLNVVIQEEEKIFIPCFLID